MKFDIQEVFPLESESYDHTIAINVLEHIYKYQNVVNESYRVIKKGGSVIFITPFMFNVHGSPDDYFRYTKSALLNILKEA
jgi:ubiquinone/menaquinone biosynthesis C-methylase UbiE